MSVILDKFQKITTRMEIGRHTGQKYQRVGREVSPERLVMHPARPRVILADRNQIFTSIIAMNGITLYVTGQRVASDNVRWRCESCRRKPAGAYRSFAERGTSRRLTMSTSLGSR